MIVRRATRSDKKIIASLLKKKYHFISLEEAASAFLVEYRQRHRFRIAEENNQIIGLISWRPQGSIRHGVAELTRLAVISSVPDPRLVKEELFDVMLAEADSYYHQHGSHLRKVYSMIHADNRHIREFFLDKGMRQEAVLKNHFHPGTDELVYSLFLT